MRAKAWFSRHAQTLFGSLGRLAQHPAGTLLTMSVIAMALALPLLLSLILQTTQAAAASWNQVFDISVYLDKKAGAGRAQSIAKQLRQRNDVAAIRVITAADALNEFRRSSGFGNALDALPDNPLPDTLVVTPAMAASNPSGVEVLRNAIAATGDVQMVQIDAEWVRRLYAILALIRRVVWVTSWLLGIGVVLVVGNTIRLDILNRRTEIEVMKLVGATNAFARRPFLYSGMWYGLGGGLLALLLVSLAVRLLSAPIDQLAGLYASQFHLRGLGFGSVFAVLGLSVGLGWMGSWLAATRHMRGIEPT